MTLYNKGLFAERIELGKSMLHKCVVCPHGCGVDRIAGELGICRISSRARVASFGPHFGEESPLVGEKGSGTIFFEGCSLHCVFCQNNDISYIDDQGDRASTAVLPEQLAAIMVELQNMGCHNINFVTPTHVVPQIIEALPMAIENGLRLPLVYNSGGYDALPVLRLLENIFDIYMPDCKFLSKKIACEYTEARNYPTIMRQAVLEMHRQVGDLVLDKEGIAIHGLLVRHLVMPGHLDETEIICRFLAEKVSRDTYINIMDQYRPCFRAGEFENINRPLKSSEFKEAMDIARKTGLHRFDERDWLRILRRLY